MAVPRTRTPEERRAQAVPLLKVLNVDLTLTINRLAPWPGTASSSIEEANRIEGDWLLAYALRLIEVSRMLHPPV